MSIFTILIYENQSDLIIENTKFQVKEFTSNLINSLNDFSDEFKAKKIKRKYAIKRIDREIKKVQKVEGFVIFTEAGTIVHKSKPNLKILDQDLSNGIKAVTSVEFSGRQYLSVVDDNKNLISFYIPLELYSFYAYIFVCKMLILIKPLGLFRFFLSGSFF